MYSPTQCDDQKKECWCSSPSGHEVPDTRKMVGGIFKNTLKPNCEEIVNPVKDVGPCGKQANLYGRNLLECDENGNFAQLQSESQNGADDAVF